MAITASEVPFAAAVSECSDDELIDTMIDARRRASQAQAEELAAVAELARRRHGETRDRTNRRVISPADYLIEEVASALTLTSRAAAELIDFALALAERLPGTLEALRSGDIDYCKARTLWHGTLLLDEALTARIEAAVLPTAPQQTTGELRAKIRRLVRKLDPDAFDRRRRTAETRRRVELTEDDNGTAYLSGCELPAGPAASAYNRIDAIAAAVRADGDERGIDQLRADVFLGLLHGSHDFDRFPGTGDYGGPADTGSERSGQDAWTEMDDRIALAIAKAAGQALDRVTASVIGDSGQPAGRVVQLPRRQDGSAPSAGSADSLVPDRPSVLVSERHHDLVTLLREAGARISASLDELKVRWCVTGPDRQGISGSEGGTTSGAAHRDPPDGGSTATMRHGSPGYRPPASMRRIIELRDERCRYPGCRTPAARADIDHTIPYDQGGVTCPCNLAVLCRRHHMLKQTKGWHFLQIWPGVLLWITPTGRWHVVTPVDRE